MNSALLAIGFPGPFEVLVLVGMLFTLLTAAAAIALVVWLSTRPRAPR